ncbi:MAG: hypothetical protein QXR89_07040 [Candidatus Bathyarchaeia archaeon]
MFRSGNLGVKREKAYKYQLVFKGEPLDLEEVRAKLSSFGYHVAIHEKPAGQHHLEAFVGDWFLQFYGTGTVNVFVKDKDDVFKVSKFLGQLGWFMLEKFNPRLALLWEVFGKSEEGKSVECYREVFNVVKAFELFWLKS